MEGKAEIIHILIVGFHHKKGCQLEFSYPSLESLPESWKHLPSLAMPDGAHNYASDVVFFHLPGVDSPSKTVYGVSCFQQIPLEKVKNRTEDMTRGTVQKAVCVLATVPLYGYIQIKMQLITAEFFKGGDFSETSLLVEAFRNLNECLPGSMENHLYDGLSVTELLHKFRHQTLLLFKLILLERKVVFFQSPVEPLCTSLLSLLSLHPGLIATGLDQAACASPMGSPVKHTTVECSFTTDNTQPDCESTEMTANGYEASEVSAAITVPVESEYGVDALLAEEGLLQDPSKNRNTGCDIEILSKLDLKACGVPLEIFQMGNLCFPYLSISYLDFLSSPGVRGFVAGATNVLFKQKRPLADVLVEIDERRIDIFCPELRKQLALSMEDLRFMDILLRGVEEERSYENWIRDHFQLYMMSLLRTSLLADGGREVNSFNANFMAAWKNTHNFKMWYGQDHEGIFKLDAGHPEAGSFSVQDIKLRLSQAMLSSESGRKLNQAVASTGRVVGGAVTQARGAISGWLSSFSQETKSIKATEHV